MAMTKCIECKEEVSTKAKVCPHCGAKVKKPIGVIGILFVILFSYIVFKAVISTSSDSNNYSSSSAKKTTQTVATQKPKAEPTKPKSAWKTQISVDEMTGKIKAYAISKNVTPSKRMEFPYADVESWMGVGCDGSSEWAYFGFSTSPNITKDETKNGYNIINSRVKWDDTVVNTQLSQEWGSKSIHFNNYTSAINRIQGATKVLLELNWHGSGRVYFDHSLNGSSAAIKEMRSKCGKRITSKK